MALSAWGRPPQLPCQAMAENCCVQEGRLAASANTHFGPPTLLQLGPLRTQVLRLVAVGPPHVGAHHPGLSARRANDALNPLLCLQRWPCAGPLPVATCPAPCRLASVATHSAGPLTVHLAAPNCSARVARGEAGLRAALKATGMGSGDACEQGDGQTTAWPNNNPPTPGLAPLGAPTS